ncbi:hypothetical protein JJB07_13670 [Tumebacillus sp. ITR2]|uniref:Uncharacterized protein n=1 Tax=Tumebacillus amylolyticus TaxID=2801339 RepID=A0ABS1JBM9_9BACL|nr:hypothetical protein [Tumebacillus amylolyticus]MBL0387684.1 hypothetical protein [Tumebacillus amylolyticus]
MEEAYLAFDCPSCGHAVTPEPLEGERGNQDAACPSCSAKFTRTFALYQGEWVFGLWRSSETGKVACTYYKTAFGTSSDDC